MQKRQSETKTETKNALSPYQVEKAEAQAGAVARPARTGDALLRGQRRVGNRAVQRLLVQLQEPEEEEEIQFKWLGQGRGGGEAFTLDDETAGRINRARGGGKPLDGALQAQMSDALGHDFSGVRAHTDSEADALNHELSARAFTTGHDIFFRRGEYNPGSGSGRELIAHELTHVVQQGTGRVSGGGSGMTVRPAGDAYEHEADDLSHQVHDSSSPSRSAVGQRQLGDHDLGSQPDNSALRLPDARPHSPPPWANFDLQRMVGNRAVGLLLASSGEPRGAQRSLRLHHSLVRKRRDEVEMDRVGRAPGRSPQSVYPVGRGGPTSVIQRDEYEQITKPDDLKMPAIYHGTPSIKVVAKEKKEVLDSIRKTGELSPQTKATEWDKATVGKKDPPDTVLCFGTYTRAYYSAGFGRAPLADRVVFRLKRDKMEFGGEGGQKWWRVTSTAGSEVRTNKAVKIDKVEIAFPSQAQSKSPDKVVWEVVK